MGAANQIDGVGMTALFAIRIPAPPVVMSEIVQVNSGRPGPATTMPPRAMGERGARRLLAVSKEPWENLGGRSCCTSETRVDPIYAIAARCLSVRVADWV